MTNEDFKTKSIKIFRKVHLLITIILLTIVLNNHITIASDTEVRVLDINFPFYKTQFLQSINK